MAPWSCHGAFSRQRRRRVRATLMRCLQPRRPCPAGWAPASGSRSASYGLWGFLPLYFLLLAPTGPFEIVALRIMLSLAFCAVLLTVTARLGRVLGR